MKNAPPGPTSILVALLITLLGAAVAPPDLHAEWSPQQLWDAWGGERFVDTPAPCLRPADLVERLGELVAAHPAGLALEEVGRSVLNRPIHMLSLGTGPEKILLWSQMHGDEPSATPALLDLADYLLRHADEPEAAAILESTTLLIVPMLNPDGAEVYERRNAQGIDINRDALNLATPEGRLLKRLRDDHQPTLGFNLHDQNRRTAVGDTGVTAVNAVLAVSGDEANTITPGRKRTRRACAAIATALETFVPGRVARYDEEWSPRSFGDNLTAWGTPVVLIESGGVPPGGDFTTLTRLNFVAILSALDDLVRDDLAGHDPAIYEALERNNTNAWTDLAVRGGSILQPFGPEPYRADLSINIERDDRLVAGCPIEPRVRSRIVELGDNRFLGAGREIDASGRLVLAPVTVRVEGPEVRAWLDAEALDALTRMGVGSVIWEVDETGWAAAEEHAAALESRGRARLTLAGPATEMPEIRLDALPTAPADPTLGALLAAIGGDAWREGLEGRDLVPGLGRLWPGGRGGRIDGPSTTPDSSFRPGQPASFLIAAPYDGGAIDLDALRIEAIWLDGAEVELE